MPKKNKIPKGANQVFREVMEGVHGPNPEHERIKNRDAKKEKEVRASLAKRAGKHTKRRHDNGDGSVDTGMFSS